MRNRAKCKLCKNIIESLHASDLQFCKCGEIYVDGGDKAYKAGANNWDNFLRVDDDGNEIMVKVVEPDTKESEGNNQTPQELPVLTRKDKLDMLDNMIKNIEGLPQQVLYQPVNHYDLFSFMALVSSILKDS